MKLLCITILILYFAVSAAATPLDSIRTIVINDRLVVLHQVEAGETLYSLARRYHSKVGEIIASNTNIPDSTLAVGSVIKIPVINVDMTKKDNKDIVFHTVTKGETLYSIARTYKVALTDIKKRNTLHSDTVRIGQVLILDKREKAGAEILVKADTTARKKSSFAGKYCPAPGVAETTVKGTATWMQDDGKAFFALHPTLPRGTVIKVKNLMNNDAVFVKVIGQLPQTQQNKDILISISSAAAKELNIFDNKFVVEISYFEKGEGK